MIDGFPFPAAVYRPAQVPRWEWGHEDSDRPGNYPNRLIARVRPHQSVTDRPTNALCFVQRESGILHMITAWLTLEDNGLRGFSRRSSGLMGWVVKVYETALLAVVISSSLLR